MTLEVLILLYGLYPISISKKTNSFWKTIDEYIALKKGDWQTAFHLLCYEWRYDKSIVIGLYNYLKKYYPFPIPKALFFSDSPSWLLKTINNKRKEYYQIRKIGGLAIEEFQIEDFANKWLRDCLSGESFLEKNRNLFTANNVNIFFRNNLQFQDDESFCRLIKQYYSSKIYPIQYLYIINILANKFKYCFNHPHVINFLIFIHNNHENIPNSNIIQGICDYFTVEIINSNQQVFSFKGRTWQSLIRICNEWHRTIEMYRKYMEKDMNQKWNKLPFINNNVINNNGKIWKFTQITTEKLLFEEGKYMHHCCFSYIDKCINGYSAIFSLRCYEENKIIDKKSATIEISEDKKLVQARGRFNNLLDKETLDIIDQWEIENAISDIVEQDVDYENDQDFYYENEEYFEDDEYDESGEAEDNYYGYSNEFDNYNENEDEIDES